MAWTTWPRCARRWASNNEQAPVGIAVRGLSILERSIHHEHREKPDFAADAETAVQLEAEAKTGPDVTAYTHNFEKPFEFRGRTVTELTFNWGALTGEDHEAIEGDMLRRGQTLTLPAFTGPYLAGNGCPGLHQPGQQRHPHRGR